MPESCNPQCKPAAASAAPILSASLASLLPIPSVAQAAAMHDDKPPKQPFSVDPASSCVPCVRGPVSDPELFASQLLGHDIVERLNLCALLHALPKDDSQASGGGKFSAGVYQRGGVAGICKTCHSHPNAVRAINQFVSQHIDAFYNAFVVIDNMASPMHRDVMNEARPNWIVPVGAFSGGGVWQQDEAGQEQRMVQGKLVCGSILDLSKPVCLHASSCFHQTEPWEGDRVVIVVFTVQFEATLTSSDVRQLMSLGFPLPLSTGDCAANPEPTKFACLDPTATNLPLIVEVFAGSARVTECCRELGLRADAVDHKPHALSKVQPLLLDLTSEDGRRGLRSVLAHPDLRAVWWAPPCGTASKARCIPLDVPNAPRPLRTEEWPDGVAGLTPLEQARVDSANTLYHLLADSVIHTIKKGVIHVVENPRSSLFWKTSAWLRFFSIQPFKIVRTAPAGPSTQPWPSRTARSSASIAPAQVSPAASITCRGACPLADSQLPKSQFILSPSVKRSQPRFKKFFNSPSTMQVLIIINFGHQQAYSPRPPRLCRSCPNTSAWSHGPALSICAVYHAAAWNVLRTRCPFQSLCQCSLDTLPAGAQLLHMHTSVKQGDGSSSCVSVWGIPYNPCEFIQAALKSVHPAVAAAKVPEPLLSAIRESKKCNPEILAKTRTDTLKQWAMRAKALESEEERFKSGLHPDVAKILAPKRLLLWKELMARYSYPDTGVFDLITSGVSLTGEVENSGLFNSVNKPATLSVQQLREEADNITDETLAQVRPQSPEIDQTVLRKTLQEVENGWLTGPIPRHLVPQSSVVCRRFGLCQEGRKPV